MSEWIPEPVKYPEPPIIREIEAQKPRSQHVLDALYINSLEEQVRALNEELEIYKQYVTLTKFIEIDS